VARPKRRTTPVERLIVFAILGIVFSIIMPVVQQASRRASRTRATAPAVSRGRQEPAGQLNTIEVPKEASGERRARPEALARTGGALIRLAITAVIVVLIASALRRRLRRAQQ
jgi:hypothetical protein